MKQYLDDDDNKSKSGFSNRLALLSLIVGACSLMICSYPHLMFGAGMAGILLAVYSRKEKVFSKVAMAGLTISISSVVFSIFLTLLAYMTFTLMKDPEYAQMVNEQVAAYEKLLEDLQPK